MKQLILIAISFMLIWSFSSCEKSVIIGGYVTSRYDSSDTIGGITIGLYKLKDGIERFNNESTWADFDFIAEATSDSNGYFTMEFDDDILLSGICALLVKQPTDTLTANSCYCNIFGENSIQYGLNNVLKLVPSIKPTFKYKNFDFQYPFVQVENLFPLKYINPGKAFTFKVYRPDLGGVYIGKTERYIKHTLPVKSEKIYWELPVQEIEIDFLQLEK